MLVETFRHRAMAVVFAALAAPVLPLPSDLWAAQRLKVENFADGLVHPWGMAFLPDGRLLVTERTGRLSLIARDGKLIGPVKGVPKVDALGQGGLLDVALSPKFAEDGLVFFSFAEPRGEGKNSTSVGRGRLVVADRSARLDSVKIIFRQQPAHNSAYHFGSRLVFARDGSLFVTTGDRNYLRREAQNPANHIGKVIHINPDGSPAADNPNKPGWAAEVWSIGHRNMQGAALEPATGRLWTVEHGARGGDEVNMPLAGRNYGWPVITYGRDYSGAKIGVGTHKQGMEQPVHYWDPSIAPSGAAFYTGSLFPDWQGDLLVGALAGQHLVRLRIKDGKVVQEERLLEDMGERIRDVTIGPDGAIWLLTDSADGQVLRVVPRSAQ